jgi:L-ascorbate metabolism protein UlaG (beta-lactamase superfamily)
MKTMRIFSPFSSWAFGLFAFTACLLAQNEARFSAFGHLTNQEAFFRFTTVTGLTCRVDVSANLSNWLSLVSFPLTNSSVLYTDSGAPFVNGRFYAARQMPGSNLVTGDHLATTNGDLVIHTMIHACIIMSWNGKTIYVDVTNKTTGLPPADLFLLTHAHADHFSLTGISNAVRSNTVILAPLAVYQSLSTYLKSLTTVLTNGSTTNLMAMQVDAIAMYNTNAAQLHPRGAGNGYVLTMGGKRIYISGDTDNIPEMRELTGIDLAFLAMRGPNPNMDIADAVRAVRAFRPRVVYPYHYTGRDPGLFKQQLGTDLGIEVRLRNWY